jgi:hypothetical protein
MQFKVGMAPQRTRTFVIDPRRKEQNNEHARRLIAFHRNVVKRARRGEKLAREAWRALSEAEMRAYPSPPAPFDDETFEANKPPNKALRVAAVLVEQAIEPLQRGLNAIAADLEGSSLGVTVNERSYGFAVPTRYDSSFETWSAPLTCHVSLDIVRAISDLRVVIFDPTPNKPLAIERARYARERTKLIEIEDWLWGLAAQYGAFCDRVPYAYRLLLLIATWLPEAHEPPGANTICIRCGELFFRRGRTSATLPRCPDCMKETRTQRQWPPHAMAPHAPGTWLLRCQYAACDSVFEGPRHRKLCQEHTSAKLPPKRRLSAHARQPLQTGKRQKRRSTSPA